MSGISDRAYRRFRCLNARQMQAYLEDPGANGVRDMVEHHLVRCVHCRGAFDRLSATNYRVNTWLAVLRSPLEDAAIDLSGALARVVRLDEPLPFLPVAPRAARSTFATWLLSTKAVSAAIHVAVFSLLMMSFTNSDVRRTIADKVHLIDPNLRPWIPKVSAGGGGSGSGSPLPVSKGQLPKADRRQFVPPMIVEQKPKLEIAPSIIAPPDAALPQITAENWGDPLAKFTGLSNGTGSGGGMGDGSGSGVGNGHGPGYGPGDGGGFTGGDFHAGHGISRPVAIYHPEPEYSDEARKARFSGSVRLSVVVDVDGRVRDIRVITSVGLGLDEKAIEAVRKWKFKPAMKDGHPIAVRATVDLTFHLL